MQRNMVKLRRLLGMKEKELRVREGHLDSFDARRVESMGFMNVEIHRMIDQLTLVQGYLEIGENAKALAATKKAIHILRSSASRVSGMSTKT